MVTVSPMGLLRRLGAVLLLAAHCLGCDLAEQARAGGRLRETIRNEYKIDSHVRANSLNGVMTVTITLERLPNDPTSARARIESLAKHEFPTAKKIVITGAL